MKKIIFGVKDLKVSEFINFYPENSAIDAQRAFISAVRDKNTKMGQFPEDYEVHEIGSFESVVAKFENLEHTKFIMSGPMVIALDEEIQRQRDILKQKGKSQNA